MRLYYVSILGSTYVEQNIAPHTCWRDKSSWIQSWPPGNSSQLADSSGREVGPPGHCWSWYHPYCLQPALSSVLVPVLFIQWHFQKCNFFRIVFLTVFILVIDQSWCKSDSVSHRVTIKFKLNKSQKQHFN